MGYVFVTIHGVYPLREKLNSQGRRIEDPGDLIAMQVAVMIKK
jgi:hypothetical protein